MEVVIEALILTSSGRSTQKCPLDYDSMFALLVKPRDRARRLDKRMKLSAPPPPIQH